MRPSKLERPPLVEAVFEMRFQPRAEGAAELLPGLMFPALKNEFPEAKATPAGTIPREIRKTRPELRYIAQFALHGRGQVLSIGENVLILNLSEPYPGWASFKALCLKIVSALHETNHVGALERFSLKYANVFNVPAGNPLAPLKIILDVGAYELRDGGLRLRFETSHRGLLTIVECTSEVSVQTPVSSKHGTLLTIDTIYEHGLDEFWRRPDAFLEQGHDVLEALFFDLITNDTLESLGPVWQR